MQETKLHILIFTHFFTPGYKAGGILRTVVNLVDHLHDKYDFSIITLDRDSKDNNTYDGIKSDEWTQLEKCKVHYTSPQNCTFKYFKHLLKNTTYDVLYLNSYFDFKFSFLPLLAHKSRQRKDIPVIIAPRGEFSEGALHLKKIKKSAFINFSKLMGVHTNLVWQASSSYEADDIRGVKGSVANKVLIAPDLPTYIDIDNYKIDRSDKGALKIIFLSRIHPKKNLQFALEVISKIDKPIIFNIYGLIDVEDYWEDCKNIIQGIPEKIRISYKGVLSFTEVHHVLSQHDIFFLPTLGENYGHVIAESLSVGTPVLISDKTPWRYLEKEGVGWDFSLDDETRFIKAIERYSVDKMNGLEIERQYIINWINNRLNKETLLHQTENLLNIRQKQFQ